MASVTTQGIVIRRADYRENDRMLTLLTPGMGRVEALCRGCRRAKSPLMSASEWFAMGEYVIFMGKGHGTVSACNVTETFYPIREDYDKLRAATGMINLCEAVVQPGQESVHLFTLLARSLGRLCYTDRDPDVVLAGFLLHFAALNGYKPELDRCVQCGKDARDAHLFDPENGGVLCRACSNSFTVASPLRPGQAEWMRQVLVKGIDRYERADEDPPVELLKKYVSMRAEKKINSL